MNAPFFKSVVSLGGRVGAAACGLFLLSAAPVPAVGTALSHAAVSTSVYYTPVNGSKLVINGTSTLHQWSATSTVLQGGLTASGKFVSAAAPTITAIKLVIPVKDIKSSEGGGMDSTMYDALHKGHHPFIRYTLKSATLKPAGFRQTAGVFAYNTTGVLRVNGVNKTSQLKLIVTDLPGSGLLVRVTTNLKMTDFNVSPPTAMLGIIRSGNTISINVAWRLAAGKANSGK